MRKLSAWRWAGIAVLALAAGTAGTAKGEELFPLVRNDESQLEQLIAAYLQYEHKLKLSMKFISEGDMVIVLEFEGSGGTPDYRIVLDSQPSANDGSERVLLVKLYSQLKVDAAQRAAVWKMINEYQRTKWAGAFYIDTDGEIVGQWALNSLATGLPKDMVHDAIVRIGMAWKALFPDVKNVLGKAGAGMEAGTAIPMLGGLRIGANESATVANLMAYATAQNIYHRTDYDADNTLEYAQDMSDLHDTTVTMRGVPKTIDLIDLAFSQADSDAGDGSDATPKAGYWFVDCTGSMNEGPFASSTRDKPPKGYLGEYALCAVPAEYKRTGIHTFVIGLEGTVYQKDTGGRPITLYPDAEIARGEWRPYRRD